VIDRFDWREASERERRTALARPRSHEDREMMSSVRAIVEDVRNRGWPALCHYSKWLDGAEPELLEVAPFAARARQDFAPELIAAMELAARNIETFHRRSKPSDIAVETMDGVSVQKLWRPIGKVGIYVPGGKAPLFSSLLMQAIPARVAGVQNIIVVTPPRREGGLDPAIALAAEMCGIEAIWTIGGAQGIAALAFGAGELQPVDLITGPGNAYVSAAKAIVSSMAGGPGIDLPAGPSELMVIADNAADPELIAADLLAQAEHDKSAQVILVTPDDGLIDAVAETFRAQGAAMGGDYAMPRAILCSMLSEAASIANDYAPEHLSLAVEEPDRLLPLISSAGAIFVGSQTAESFGDYCLGSSHVLPTGGAARFTGGISTATFMRPMTVQRLDPAAASALAAPAALLARAEGLEAHARAAERRA
jgi:histidinol dehydrogenase